jgi:Zn-dependent peptidase ImmA (M78 family)
MESQSPAIAMYEKDIEELEKLIGISIRPNIKRQLTEYKNNLTNLMKEEKKKIEAEIKKKEEESKKEKTDTTKENKVSSEIDQSKLNASFTTISKYAFDTSNNKFIKL